MSITLLTTIMLVAGWSAVSADDVSVADLRAHGQASVDELHKRWSEAAPDARAELQKALDRVCAQKDCHASRLYWYTDLEQAKEKARWLGRPVLSLHLLGRLDEELSCANSRFFRTLLYSDDTIARIMREDYVLHWHSVRPVPLVTIEMGDGRVIRQTITGNSAHYLLSSDGAVLDMLPGLYSPDAFRERLEEWVQLDREVAGPRRAMKLQQYHQLRFGETNARAIELGISRAQYSGQQPVWIAQQQARSKAAIEIPMMRQLQRGGVDVARTLPVARAESDEVRFSESTLALMRTKQTLTDALLDNLRRTVASDTQTNEYDLHRRVHEWFARGEVTDLQSLNERVYDELFQTPSSDPWLGLVPESVFVAMKE
ncbi:MAG TPA: hypothetical protein VEK79_13875 [Thermoanaerobaculia bacterium]|nr:hypothetical protein [Thermoanaerobaculia bacterium]